MAFEDDAPAPARPVPKFVPTLTETIGVPSGTQAASTPVAAAGVVPPETSQPAAPSAPVETDERIAQAMLEQLGPDLDKLVSEAVARVVHEQMLGLAGRVRTEVARTVREQVARQLLAHTKRSGEES
ncbi:hypothetical protein [Ottowia sp.]|uniref:hypothetical protein n=1 Tax=Ottowia sp. TaxID=1898956 RepID=UPI002608D0F8|nr:hypothetical protein [Ottowia sp.]